MNDDLDIFGDWSTGAVLCLASLFEVGVVLGVLWSAAISIAVIIQLYVAS